MDNFYEIITTSKILWNLIYTRYISMELFSFRWFITVANMAIFYTLLYLIIDRSRLRELFFFGSLLSVGYGYVDTIGTTTALWAYKSHFLPFKPSLMPYSYTLHPIIHMFAYQYADNWRRFLITNTFATAFFAFVAQPFYAWVGILWLENWSYLYSFLIAWSISFVARAVVLWMARVEQNHAPRTSRLNLSPALQPAMKPIDKDNELDNHKRE
ncbi:CBO0543 family protein [Dendrosporobacter sp. 1207_IL3150]|uniref:CBO0543 family protein n=1 Tax=Dendrosporobacter sp. 1207_IL3150 TaxID=3084054 RepID=UPI002FDA7DE9